MNEKVKKIAYQYRFIIILAVVMAVLTMVSPNFLQVKNLMNVLWAVAVIGIMASGTIYVILLGGIDLSVGSVACLSGIIVVFTVMRFDHSPASVVLGICLALIVGLFIGMIHGIITTTFGVPAFLITMATQTIINGVAMAITGGETFGLLKPKLFLDIGKGNIPVIIMVVMALISFFILNKTVFGREIYGVGGNTVASELSGINSRRVTIYAYMISGLTAAIGGVVLSSMAQQASSLMAKGYEMDVLTAIVVGGTSLFGGEGTVQGAIFGAVLVGLINNGLNLINAPSTYHPVVKGIVIIAAVALDFYVRNNEKIKRSKKLTNPK